MAAVALILHLLRKASIYFQVTITFDEVLIMKADLIGNVHNESFWINGMALFINELEKAEEKIKQKQSDLGIIFKAPFHINCVSFTNLLVYL